MQNFIELLSNSPIGFLEGRFRSNHNAEIVRDVETLKEGQKLNFRNESEQNLVVLFEKDNQLIGKLSIPLTKENSVYDLFNSEGPDDCQFGSMTLLNCIASFPGAEKLPKCCIELMYDHTGYIGRFIAWREDFDVTK